MTESQLQILALAEEVERLQVALSDEQAARDALRRHFLKLSSPAATAAGQQRAADSFHSAAVPPEVGGTERIGNGKLAQAEVAEVELPPRESVVGRVQRAAHGGPSLSGVKSGAHRAKQPLRAFSLWSFITGADRVGHDEGEWA